MDRKSKNHIYYIPFALFLFAFFIPKPGVAGIQRIAKHIIDVKVDLEARSVAGTDTLMIEGEAGELRLLIRKDSNVSKIIIDGTETNFTINEGTDAREIALSMPEGKQAVVYYSAVFPPVEKELEKVKRGVAYVEDGVIGPEGVFLPSGSLWYPQEEDSITLYDLTVELPAGYTAVTEGGRVFAKRQGSRISERWRTTKPVDGLDLVASRFIYEQERYNGVDIYTFFLNKDEKLSRLYIDKTKGYLDMYQGLIGPYPYEKFAVVESFLPTGYGMPSFTLLGSSVIRLPFIPDTSLGHEIAHNWWGNSVFIDPSQGNWVEALTTYTADYLYEKRKGPVQALEFRRSKLRGYKNYAGDSLISLSEFIDSTTIESRAVGYNKGLMVFNMLEGLLGADTFDKGLRLFYSEFAFKRANWADIRMTFEKASGKDLGWFFEQWVTRPGGPHLTALGAKREKTDSAYEVRLAIKQKEDGFMLDLPVLIKTDKGDEWRNIRLEGPEGEFSLKTASRPESVEVDPEYQVFRILSDREMPPSFASLFGAGDGMLILPQNNREKYAEAAGIISKDFGLKVETDTDAGLTETGSPSALIIGSENRLFGQTLEALSKHVTITPEKVIVAGKEFPAKGTVIAAAVKKPKEEGKALCYLFGDGDAARFTDSAKRLKYFTEWSYIVFPMDGKPEKGTFEAEKALRFELN